MPLCCVSAEASLRAQGAANVVTVQLRWSRQELGDSMAQHRKVRGENGPGCWAMRPVDGDRNMCLFQWLLDTDLKVLTVCLVSFAVSPLSGLDTSVHHRQGPLRSSAGLHRQHQKESQQPRLQQQPQHQHCQL